jgi:hypothetical protein
MRRLQKLVTVLEHRRGFNDLCGSAVNATALEGAFDFVSVDAPCENGASMCMDTGRISWTSIAVDVEEEALPADLATSDRSIEVPQPHKNDLGLGARLRASGDHEAVGCLRTERLWPPSDGARNGVRT